MKKSQVFFCVFFSALLFSSCTTPSPTAANPVATQVARTASTPTQTGAPAPTPTSPPPTADPTAAPTDGQTEPAETAAAPTDNPTGSGVISGQVWHDICATREGAGGTVEEAGEGCIFADQRYRANGVHEAADPGLGAITVILTKGSCAEQAFAETVTDPDGFFRFSGLLPGSYCVHVDASDPLNQENLGNGLWTAGPESGGGYFLDLDDGEARDDLEFGWDFDDLPILPTVDCVEGASFVADVTIPDYTSMRPGESFEKIWRVRNEGTCTWTPDYSLANISEYSFGAVELIPFPSTVAPGATVDFSVAMQAPESGGTYFSNWQFVDSEGQQFGIGIPPTEYLWVLISVTFVNSDGSPAATALPPAAGNSACLAYDGSMESQVFSLINAERVAAGLAPLNQNGKLSAAAQVHSADMAANDFVNHTGSDGSLWYGRLAAQGYAYSNATENIYVGNPAFGGTPEGALAWWMNSQVHRDNILNTDVTQMGVGYVYCGTSTYGGYYTVVFARP